MENDDGKKYEIIIFWSPEDNSYIAEVPELPGCMADGKTYQEALADTIALITEKPYAPLLNNLALWLCPIVSPKAMAAFDLPRLKQFRREAQIIYQDP